MNEKLQAWRQEGKHLPDILKDFHDAKDVFLTMHEMIGPQDPGDIIKQPSVVEGQCYVVDCFLWFMARHGYTLQRSRSNQEFDSIEENMKIMKEHRMRKYDKAIGFQKENQ